MNDDLIKNPSTPLGARKCTPCKGGIIPFSIQEAEKMLMEVDMWQLSANGRKIIKPFEFKNFTQALAFANKVGEIAEEENHHPDMFVGWGKVRIELSTRAIGGLSENDFILAAKIDRIEA